MKTPTKRRSRKATAKPVGAVGMDDVSERPDLAPDSALPVEESPKAEALTEVPTGVAAAPSGPVGAVSEAIPPDAAPEPADIPAAAQPGPVMALRALPREEPGPAQDEVPDPRMGYLAQDVGWLLVTAGVIGIVVPGVLGTPFLVMGAMALWPGNRERVERWRQGGAPKCLNGGIKQINRFLDDVERRYPRDRKP